MRRHRVFAALAGVVMLTVALAAASLYSIWTEWPAADPAEDFTVHVTADSDAYGEDETVGIVTRVCSRRLWWRVTSTSPVSWQILDEHGNTVADTSHRIHQMIYISQRWAPRQCRTWHDEWDQHYWNQEERRSFTGPVRGDRVPPGEYRTRASWTAISGRDTPPLSHHPAVESSPFRIQR